ncbi:MAG TPA: sulfate ABC transporter substrate-binding protein [Candidatus Saccharimonadia bacterium]|nr:sulfate ABC transporter substrate-binding protein [Candidatus Saccharimonadia bacterium]
MSFKVLMRVFLVFMISVGLMPMATAQQDSTLLQVSSNPPRELYQEVNTIGRETRYAQVTRGDGKPKSLALLNVSYDPTRELWRNLNTMFISKYLKEANTKLEIKQSHGGSSTQARAVIDGLEADVVTLALWSDTDAIRKKGLIAEHWEQRLPNRSLPYISTIVFVVRKGNPKSIKDWPDLVQPGIAIVTPNPKTSGNGQLSFYSAWGSVVLRGGSREDAIAYITKLYQQVPVLDSGARGATMTFVQKGIGDVHLAWENEAHLEVQEANGTLELVYPPLSMRAEPHVAVVDANVDRKGTRAAAEAYLQFLYTDEAQEIIAKHYYRPTHETILKKHRETFPEMRLFVVTDIGENWEDVYKKLVGDGSVFDTIYKPKRK